MNSGGDFRTVQASAGDPIYGFSSQGYAKAANSPYWMDEPTYQDMQSRYQDPETGAWDSVSVKNELALPCYNQADAVYNGQLTTNQDMVVSTINPAQEGVTHVGEDGTELTKLTRTMSGGGTQFAPAKGTVGNVSEFIGP